MQYVFTVQATDNGNPNLHTKTLVLVDVIDVNDNNPIFSPTLYTFNISDTLPLGTIVGTLTATDVDNGTNGDVSYILEASSGIIPFQLFGNLVIISGLIDFTQVPVYQFDVTAIDNAPVSSRLSSIKSAKVTVNIHQSNGTAPKFQQELYNVSVSEITSNDVIIQVQATDSDTGNFGSFRYSLRSSVDSELFNINPNSGEIRIKDNSQKSLGTKKTRVLFVAATDAIGLFDIAYVVIHVTSVIRPSFTQLLYVTALSENAPVGSLVATVSAKSNQGVIVTYSIVSGNERNKFSLSDDGNLRIAELLSLEVDQLPTYTLEVSATDNFGEVSALNATIVVSVIYENGSGCIKPIFLQSVYPFGFVEGTISIVGRLFATISTGDVRYSISYNDKVSQDDFVINPSTGAINAVRPFDRELIDQYVFQAIATNSLDANQNDKTTVIVTILDANDNSPQFIQGSLETSISELAVVGTLIAVVSANDIDSGSNGVITYSLDNSFGSLFSIDNNGRIVLEKSLDYERITSYSFNVLGTDLGNPPRVESLSVTINIINENDKKPIFNPSSVVTIIPESSSSMQSIVMVSATDEDPFGNLQYSIINNFDGLFTIDPSTGLIGSSGPLDFEINHNYDICVQANDAANPAFTTTINVRIMLEDLNDNTPFASAQPNPAIISEAAPIGQIVSVVQAQDLDTGTNADVDFSIVSGNNNLNFIIDNFGQIHISNPLDYEDVQSHTLQISVTDKGTQPLQTLLSVMVNVVNSNDNNPKFSQLSYTASIDEGIGIRRVIQVSASDLDDLSVIEYTIFDYTDTFSIDSNGVINTITDLDYEIQSQYIIVISASDGNRVGFATVNVTVLNINDQPTIARFFNFTVAEETGADILVGCLLGTDMDPGQQGQLNYNITGGNINSAFLIESSGNIITAKSLDYEDIQSYTLDVQVTDGALSAFTVVTVEVINQNDNIPKFSQDQYTVTVPENSAMSLSIQATDADNQGAIEYSIITKTALQCFEIDANKGVINSIKTLDFETWSELSFTVKAVDSGGKAGYTEILVLIQSRNDNKPVFDQTSYNVALPSSADIDYSVTRVFAKDNDLGLDGQVEYFIQNGNLRNAFRIQTDGIILVNNALDPNIIAYQLFIIARDNGQPSQSSDPIEVRISLIEGDPSNQATVMFNQDSYTKSVNENNDIDNVILTVTAIIQSGAGGIVIYSLPDATSIFTINATTGAVKTTEAFDFENIESYSFSVVARNSLNSNILDVASVKINVINMDDSEPQFLLDTYVATVPESALNGTSIITVSATDVDTILPNQGISYSIILGNDGDKFVINSGNGEIVVSASLNYDDTTSYLLTVQAISGQQSGTALVDIKVLNVNQFQPVLTKTTYNVRIAESTTTSRSITQIEVTDNDADHVFSYQLIGDEANSYFQVDDLGEITNKVPLDYESRTIFRFCVQIADTNATDVKYVVASVTVSITNIVDTLPVFVGTYQVEVPFTYPTGVEIILVSATDPEGSTLTYSLVDDQNGLFLINGATGSLELAKLLNSSQTFSVKVIATNTADLSSQTQVNITFDGTSFGSISNDPLVVDVTNGTSSGLTIEIDAKAHFGNLLDNFTSFDVYAQAYYPDNPGFEEASLAEPVSYREATINGGVDNNFMKRVKVAQVDNINDGNRRKRRAAELTPTGVIRVVVGSDEGCQLNSDPNSACSGPLEAGTRYRFLLVGRKDNGVPQFSTFSDPTLTQSGDTSVSGPSINIYYIVGLCVMGAIIVMAIVVIATLLFYKKRENIDERGKFHNTIVAGVEEEERAEEAIPHAKRYRNPLYSPESSFSDSSSVIQSGGYDVNDPQLQTFSRQNDLARPIQSPHDDYQHRNSGRYRATVEKSQERPQRSQRQQAESPPPFQQRSSKYAPQSRSETQEAQLTIDQSDGQMYIMKRQEKGGGGFGPFDSQVPVSPTAVSPAIPQSASSVPQPPAPPPLPPTGQTSPPTGQLMQPAVRPISGSTNQPRLTRTDSGRVILQHVFPR